MQSMRAAEGKSPMRNVAEAKEVIPGFGLPMPRFLPRRYRLLPGCNWTGHLAFANDLITATQPSLIVELGTHWGESYFTFCQAVEEQGISCQCYAVDHWLGDKHSGQYGEEVFAEVSQYNERHYGEFSHLLRSGFDDARPQFADGSIDLLHIDGLHTYEAACRDFRTWLSKVKSGGIVLLHAIGPRFLDFGVWRLWEEIQTEFVQTFKFEHSQGLGVLRTEGDAKTSPLTEYLFGSCPAVQEELRRHYVIYASHLENLLGQFADARAREKEVPPVPEIKVQVFPHGAEGYSAATSLTLSTKVGAWNTLVFELPTGTEGGPLRIDPADQPCFVEIGHILIHAHPSGNLLWSSSGEPRKVVVAGTAGIIPSDNGTLLVSFGDDPQLVLQTPELPGVLKVSITLRVSLAPNPVPEVADALVKASQAAAQEQVAAARFERNTMQTALDRTTTELERMRSALHQAQAAHQAAQAAHQAAHTDAQVALGETQAQLLVAEEQLRREQTTRTAMQQSLSWRVTEPMRRLMTALRSGARKNG